MKDKKACIFYFLMVLIFLDFGKQLRILSFQPSFAKINNCIFSIEHVTNTGFAFGLFHNSAYALAILGIAIVLFLSFYVYKNVSFKDKLTLFSITIFCAGSLGNIIERIQYGHVFDYIKLNFMKFPVFNAFDVMICSGVLIYTVFLFYHWKTKGFENDN